MKKSITFAMAFMAAAASATTIASAADRGDMRKMRFEKADADSSGDVSFEEFAAAMQTRMTAADTSGDGKITMEELASEIEKQRAQRMAKRLMDRFDTNGDGVMTKEEVEARQKKVFAFLDRNDDGKIVESEMVRGKWQKRQ